jgi:hypothetical protein
MTNDEALLFSKSEPVVYEMYKKLMEEVSGFGKITIEFKKTSIHIVKNAAAFLGVHPKKNALDLNVVFHSKIDKPFVRKTEQVSKNRFHNEIRLSCTDDMTKDLLTAIKESYDRCS